MQTAFDPNAVEKYKRPGNAVISGQAFMRQRGGAVVTCAAEDVTLVANTTYVAEADRAMSRGERLSPDARHHLGESVVKQTVCDAQGNFAFSGVVPGNYLVGTSVK